MVFSLCSLAVVSQVDIWRQCLNSEMKMNMGMAGRGGWGRGRGKGGVMDRTKTQPTRGVETHRQTELIDRSFTPLGSLPTAKGQRRLQQSFFSSSPQQEALNFKGNDSKSVKKPTTSVSAA